MKNTLKLANKISAKCLVSGLGHDWVYISRDCGSGNESWMECYECGMNGIELEILEKECLKHKMKCISCGFPMMKERAEKLANEPIGYDEIPEE